MSVEVPRLRRRLGFLDCNKCRLPARVRMTLPVAVILNRLATAFFVLMPLGRRILILSFKRTCNIESMAHRAQVVFSVLPVCLFRRLNNFWQGRRVRTSQEL